MTRATINPDAEAAFQWDALKPCKTCRRPYAETQLTQVVGHGELCIACVDRLREAQW